MAKVAFQLASANRSGLHRDEMYYLAGGHHLAWGYVDHPPLVPALYRLGEALFGHTQLALHVLPAFVGGVYVVVGALLARELGGRRFAQGLTATIAALGVLYLTTSHFLSTVSVDLIAWAIASLLVIRIVRTGNVRLWLGVGAVVGVGLLNKHTMAFWVVGAVVGLLATPQRTMLRSRWVLGGAAIAAAFALPNLVWQAQHDWATWTFLQNLRANNAGSDTSQFIPTQLVIVTLGGTVVWVTALWALVRRPAWAAYRWLAVGYALLFVVLFASGGKGYYLGSWYLPLVALGAVVIERTWSRRAGVAMIVAVVVTGLPLVPLSTPVFSDATEVSWGLDDANKDLGGMLGWHHIAQQIGSVVHGLPARERARAVVVTGDYSEAGAVDFWRADEHLPPAYSGHNSYWWWGHPNGTDHPVVAVGMPASVLARYWDDCRRAATLGRDGVPIDPQERGAPIFVCSGQRASWDAIWPHLRDYG